MAEITLPRYILTTMNMPGGRRTAKKPVFKAPAPPMSWWDRHKMQEPKGYQPEELKGVFEGWEYRFWSMNTWLSPSAKYGKGIITECRGCGTVGSTEQKIRQMHFNQGGCAKRLCAAYKLLLRDKLCLVCNTKTTQQKWGVPLCGSACQQAWCETETQPKALIDALLLVGDE